MTQSWIYLVIGLLLSNVIYLMTRSRKSHNSPVKFSLTFWLSDNYIKIGHSVGTAIILNLLVYVDVAQTNHLLSSIPIMSTLSPWFPIYSLGLGLFPDAALSAIKHRFGWMSPKKASDDNGKTYKRKDK